MVYREMDDYLLSSYISGLNIVVYDVRIQMATCLCPLLSCWSVSGQLRVVHKFAHLVTSLCHAVTYHIFTIDGG
jgi:hypothetical protein